MPKVRGFKIASLNIVSLPKHIDELRIVMSNIMKLMFLPLTNQEWIALYQMISYRYTVIHGLANIEIDLVMVLASAYQIQLIIAIGQI